VSDGFLERTLTRGALGIRMNPLVIKGGISELIDLALFNLEVVGDPNGLADVFFKFLEASDRYPGHCIISLCFTK
jgi:hypothetical protein